MATVTGYTAAKMEALANEQIVGGAIVGDLLTLTTRSGTVVVAGNVRGPQGLPGTDPSIKVVTRATRPTGVALTNGLAIYETDTGMFFIYNSAIPGFVYQGGMILCTSTTRPAIPFNGLIIYETDTYRRYLYDVGTWIQIGGPAFWFGAALTNGWVDSGGTYPPSRISKVNNEVHIQGRIQSGVVASVAFILPTGFRPAYRLDFAIQSVSDGVQDMIILADGSVYPGLVGNSGKYINCAFRLG